MGAQSALNALVGSVIGGVGTAIKMGKDFNGIDEQMAKKAELTKKQKIAAIKAQKERFTALKLKLGGNK